MTKPWHRRARHAVGHSLKVRLVLVFLLLAGAMAFTFISGVQKALSVGWRDGARPMLMDYVDRLAADITVDKGGPPSIERAKAITQRLPVTVSITGPLINWQSHPGQSRPEWQRDNPGSEDDWNRERWGGDKDWQRLLKRTTADGHTIEFGLNDEAFERRPRLVGFTLTALLLLTLLAFLYIRRLLRPLDDIRAGAMRFGAGEFGQPIPVRKPNKPDELGELAATINTMGADIHQMLDAKRALLLAISHELRSPLTRARLNTELLPETPDVQPSREALLRDLALMRDLVTDLLESERLASPHVALQREPTDLATLAAEVVRDVVASLPDDP
ncbi:MAG TPA: HAMP domain-containing sensor histidine kinase, partial [Burkholderiaceae bacterium]|nr:HAMP domain-containing sensor histidine kinase [Burkholderiaceae bacterium]